MSKHLLVAEDDPLWLRFWALYPKRQAKKDARKAWAEVMPSATDVARMEAALEWQVHQQTWIKDGGQFIPLPGTWLRGVRWLDEQPAATGKHLAPRYTEWVCPHLEPCGERHHCASRVASGRERFPVRTE